MYATPRMKAFFCLLALSLAAPAFGQSSRTPQPLDPGAPVRSGASESIRINGRSGSATENPAAISGVMVPDGTGSYSLYGSGKTADLRESGLSETSEVKLLAGELATQMFGSGSQGYDLGQTVSPTTFTQLGGTSSDLGRYLGEMMLYELTKRRVTVKEFRGAPVKQTAKGKSKAKAPAESLLVLAGNYYYDSQTLTVTARLVRPDGAVVKSAVVITPLTKTLRAMLGISSPSDYAGYPRPVTLNVRDASDSTGYRSPKPYAPSARKKSAPKKAAAKTSAEASPAKAQAKPDPGVEIRMETTTVAPRLETTTVSPDVTAKNSAAKAKE